MQYLPKSGTACLLLVTLARDLGAGGGGAACASSPVLLRICKESNATTVVWFLFLKSLWIQRAKMGAPRPIRHQKLKLRSPLDLPARVDDLAQI
jgi:hypothetical protein